jgi:hypothetical protein
MQRLDKPKERNYLAGPGVGGNIIKMHPRKLNNRIGFILIRGSTDRVVGYCGQSNEHLSDLKLENFETWQLLASQEGLYSAELGTECFAMSMLDGSLSPQHGASTGCGWRNGLQLWRLAADILNKQPRTDNKGWSSSMEVGRGVNNPSP